MRIGNVEIDNFQSIGSIRFNLDNKGLVLIEGENLDDPSQKSNGSGKSSVTDALDWCLYDVTARGQSGDDIVHNVTKKNTRVSLELIDGDLRYLISRHRKHKEHKDLLIVTKVEGEVETNLTGGTNKLTQQLLKNILGASEYVFKNAVYCGQDDMPDLPSLTDKPLKVLIEEAAGIEDIQLASDMAGKEAAKTKAALLTHESTVGQLLSKKEMRTADLSSAVFSRDEWAVNRKAALVDLKASIVSAMTNLKTSKEAHEAIDIAPVQEAQAAVRALIEGVEGESATLAGLQATVNALAAKKTRADTLMAVVVRNINSIKTDIENIGKKVGTDCRECGKEYHEEDLTGALAALKKRLVEEATAAKTAKADAAKLQEDVEAAVSARDEFQESMTDISEEVARDRELTAQITAHTASHRALMTAANQVKELRARLEEKTAEINPMEKRIAALVTQLEEIDAEIIKAQEKGAQLQKDDVLAREVQRVFGPAGVRAHILDTITPFLNSRTATYLSALTDGVITAVWSTISKLKSGEMTEKFSIDVSSSIGSKSYKGLSGGEKRKVKLACAMALQDLVASRASKPFELFMADEIDDGIDESGLERLMSILDQKSKDKGTVLVVSHNSLSDWIRQVVVMRKEGLYSSLHGEALN